MEYHLRIRHQLAKRLQWWHKQVQASSSRGSFFVFNMLLPFEHGVQVEVMKEVHSPWHASADVQCHVDFFPYVLKHHSHMSLMYEVWVIVSSFEKINIILSRPGQTLDSFPC